MIADESSRLYDAMHGIIPRLTPLVLDNFGLDYAKLAAANPRIVLVRMPAFGLDGPAK